MSSRGIAQIEQRLFLDGWVDILLQLIPQMNNIKPCGFKCGGNTIATLRWITLGHVWDQIRFLHNYFSSINSWFLGNLSFIKKMQLNKLPVWLFRSREPIGRWLPSPQVHNLRQYSLCNQRSDKAFRKAIPLHIYDLWMSKMQHFILIFPQLYICQCQSFASRESS